MIIIEPKFLEHCKFRAPDTMVSGSGELIDKKVVLSPKS